MFEIPSIFGLIMLFHVGLSGFVLLDSLIRNELTIQSKIVWCIGSIIFFVLAFSIFIVGSLLQIAFVIMYLAITEREIFGKRL